MPTTPTDLAAALVPLPDRAVHQAAVGLTHWLMPGEVGNLTLCSYRSDDPAFDWHEADPETHDCAGCLAALELAADLTARTIADGPDALREVGAAHLLAAHHIDGAGIHGEALARALDELPTEGRS